MEAELDKWDRAFCRHQIVGLSQLMNRQVSEWKSQHELISAMGKSIDKLTADLEESAVKIGELQGRIEELETKHATMAKWIKDRLKNGVAQ